MLVYSMIRLWCFIAGHRFFTRGQTTSITALECRRCHERWYCSIDGETWWREAI